ncbi:outer membrane beta-barrel protein, partial [Aliivibrio fischeri]
MKKTALLLSVLCALLSQKNMVQAEEAPKAEKSTFENVFFIGTKTSYQQSVDNSLDNSPSSIGYGFFGGYQINKNWSWDLGYQSLGQLETEDVAVANSLIESAFKYNYFFNESKWSGYGRLGFARWNVTKTSMGIEDSAGGFSPLLELGFDYTLTSNWVGNIGYQYISSIGDVNTGQMDSHALMFGLKYQFTGKSKQKNAALAEQQRK